MTSKAPSHNVSLHPLMLVNYIPYMIGYDIRLDIVGRNVEGSREPLHPIFGKIIILDVL